MNQVEFSGLGPFQDPICFGLMPERLLVRRNSHRYFIRTLRSSLRGRYDITLKTKPMLKFFNTLSRQVEDFQPIEDKKVRMYMCGPTVWNFAHIGNFRTFVFGDILRRYLKFKGYEVTHVFNLTDVDDRIINESKARSIKIDEF